MYPLHKRCLILFFFLMFLFSFFVGTFFLSNKKNTLVIGAKNFTENRLLAEMIAISIEEKTSLKVKRNVHLEGTFICLEALLAGDIDIYPEYSGTIFFHILKQKNLPKNQSFENYVREKISEKYPIDFLDPFGFSNSYVLMMKKEKAKKLHIETLSDLFHYLQNHPSFEIGLDPEFISREEIHFIKRGYNWKETLTHPQSIDQALLFLALQQGSIDLISGNHTAPEISYLNLHVLKDDKNVLPKYEVAPLIRKKTVMKYPFLKEILKRLENSITVEEMRELSLIVDKKGKTPYEVARGFLLEKGLI